ncbi:hypothetical protein CYMTET_12197 [Cymbomonas tetramitiformis]|uniref:RING-type domain-containing protein n=1 Tax=Cymbomonas tetramitiformis TaxID=36881 RepID=A0AAE0GL20_9CHLO|nr:hypothetical protein CYMTET_12197 [Cymbomonas tetramitiformis]
MGGACSRGSISQEISRMRPEDSQSSPPARQEPAAQGSSDATSISNATTPQPAQPSAPASNNAEGGQAATEKESSARRKRKLGDADRFFFEGNFHAYHNELQEAVEAFTVALSLRPTFAKALYQRGHVLLETNQVEPAIEDFNKAIELNYSLAHVGRGKAFLLQQRASEALVDLKECLASRPDYAVAYHLRAAAYELLGRADDAQKDQKKVEELDSLQKLCVICMDAKRVTRLEPCQHAAMCAECAEDCSIVTQKCPLCGVKIMNVEFGYFATTYAPSDSLGTSACMAGEIVRLAALAEESSSTDPAAFAPLPQHLENSEIVSADDPHRMALSPGGSRPQAMQLPPLPQPLRLPALPPGMALEDHHRIGPLSPGSLGAST